MARLCGLVFLLLVLSVSDRVFGCESRIGADGETDQICSNPGEFRGAVPAADVSDLGIETFESLHWSHGLSGFVLRGQTGFYSMQHGFGRTPEAGIRAIGFSFVDEPVAQSLALSSIVTFQARGQVADDFPRV